MSTVDLKDSEQWSSYVTGIYTSRRGPKPLGTVSFEEIKEKAREKLKDYPLSDSHSLQPRLLGAFLYAAGSAGMNATEYANRKGLDKYAIVPRMLVNATKRSLETNIFGVTHPSPIFIAPIGVQGIFHGDAELAPASAAGKLGISPVVSTLLVQILPRLSRMEDAEKALEYGVDGIVVSNHGGRQVDGAIPSIYALENIMKSAKVKGAQASGKLTVLFDSGIRTGPDILKALALGAQAVLLGRPWVYGLIVGGEAGVEQVIRHTLGDLDTTLGLAGCKSLNDVQGKGDAVITKLDFIP
ncbi:hypothetical protein J132_07845 [Termitomyces sp. J132]|nr:hypothetical protein J132_07845 [Termitomyces sp. J132]